MTPEIVEIIMLVLGALITAFVGWITRQSNKRWGVELNDSARATLHSALNTGALMALSRLTDHVEKPSRDDLVRTILDHVKGDGAGDSVVHLKVSDDKLRSMATVQLMQAGNELYPLRTIEQDAA